MLLTNHPTGGKEKLGKNRGKPPPKNELKSNGGLQRQQRHERQRTWRKGKQIEVMSETHPTTLLLEEYVKSQAAEASR